MTKLFQHFLVFQIQSQSIYLRDCHIKNLRLLIQQIKVFLQNWCGLIILEQDKAPFTPNIVVNLYNVYEWNRWSKELNAEFEFTLKDCLLGYVKIAINADPDKSSYSGYGIGFDSCSHFSIPNFDWNKNFIIFWVDMSSSVHIDSMDKDILILGKEPTQLNNTTLKTEAEYSINFPKSQRKFCSNLHYSGSNSLLFVNARKNISIQSKNSEIKPYPLCLEKISKDFTASNMKKNRIKWIRIGLWIMDTFSVDYNIIGSSNIINIHKIYNSKQYNIK